MKPQGSEFEDAGLRPVEALLREAAGFEPDEPAPANLAYNALSAAVEREAERERRSRPQRKAALFSGLLAGAGAAWGTIALAISVAQPASGPVRSTAVEPAPEKARLLAHSGVPTAAPQRVVAGEAARVRPSRRRSRRLRSAGSRRRQRPAPPQAPSHWKVETIHQTVALVAARGWVVEEDQETGALVATPGVASLIVDPSQLVQMEEAEVADEPVETPSPRAEPEPAAGIPQPNQE